MLKEIIAQRRAPEIAQPPVIAQPAALANPDPMPLVLDELRGIVAKLSTTDERKVAVDEFVRRSRLALKPRKQQSLIRRLLLIA
jgi:hypothetical protein